MNDLFMLPHLDIKWSMINQIELFRRITFTAGPATLQSVQFSAPSVDCSAIPVKLG